MNPLLRFQRVCAFRNIYLFTALGVVILYFSIKELENLSTSSNYTNIKKGRKNVSSYRFKQDLQDEIRLKLEEEAELAETLTCKIPTLIPNGEEVMKLNHEQFIQSGYTPSCVNNNSTKFKMDYGSKLIRLNVNDSFWEYAQCCYVNFWRVHKQPDFKIVSSSMCYNITTDSQILPKHHAFIRIKCTHKNTNQIIYEDHLGHFSLESELVEERTEHSPDDATQKLSIVIFGMDSISHMNFQRYMPKAHKYLVDVMEAVEFEGFTSLGAGVRENIFPMISGLTLSEFRASCWPLDQTYMDKCPFILGDLKGYVTSFQEDDSNHSMFKDSKSHGFANIPFDYDLRVLTQGLENITIGHGLNFNNRNQQTQKFNECYGSRLSFKYLLDNMLLLMDLFKKIPHIHFTWTQSLTRTLNEFAKFGDEPLLSALQEMVSRQLLNRTALIIMSNQGMSYGPLREKTEQGFLEERLPLLYIVLPKWFKRKYRRATRNLKRNSKILTTTLDLYMSFLKLVNLTDIDNSKVAVSTSKVKNHHRKRRSPNENVVITKAVQNKSNLRYGDDYVIYGPQHDEDEANNNDNYDDDVGLSLFSPISSSRTCESAQINDLFCICLEKMDVAVNESVVIQATSFILSEMNKKLLLFPVCSPLKLNKIQSAHLLKDQKSVVGLPRSRARSRFHRDDAGGNAFVGVENSYRSATVDATTTPTKRISGSQSQSKSTSSPPRPPPPAHRGVPIGNGMGANARKSFRNQIKGPRIFKITFSTLPSGALYEASVKNVQVRIKNHENLFILGEINRIGDYRYSQKCSPTIELRPYCVC